MISEQTIKSIQQLHDPRKERCGVILGNTEILEIRNMSNNPNQSFLFNKKEWLTILNSKQQVTCIWHTHPIDVTPSEADKVNQKKFKIPFLIVTNKDYLWLT